jgi:transposase, IS5 family
MGTTMEQTIAGLDERMAKLTEMGDKLVDLNEQIDWESFRPDLNRVHEKNRKSNAGAKPIDVILMFKILVLQQLNNLSDDAIEYFVNDRWSYQRFLGLGLADRVPDAKTIWLFRENLKKLGLVEILFKRFHDQLAARGYVARNGQMIDATFVEVPRQRNSREENAQIKQGTVPEEWQETANADMLSQKDTDARWTKKNNQNHYGYKNHVNVDQDHKLIQNYQVTHAAVHDSQVFDELLDHSVDEKGKKRPAYADSAYRSKEKEEALAKEGIASQICEKGNKNNPLTDEQKASNREKSKVRSRVEHVFGAQQHMGGHVVRTIGQSRAEVKIGMMNLVYNMVRFGQLLKRDRVATPAMA